MTGYRLSGAAKGQIAEIYAYTHAQWGGEQADRYYRQLFAMFEAIAARRVPWRPIAPEFGVEGCFRRCGHHIVYWNLLEDGRVGIVAILHERMHQLEPLRAVWEP